MTPNMLCAGYKDGEKDACQGDSGGAIVKKIINDDGSITHVHVGVVSWAIGCARSNKPGVYARTSAAYSWIKRQVCGIWNSIDTEFCPNNNQNLDSNQCPSDYRNLTVSITTDKYPAETS